MGGGGLYWSQQTVSPVGQAVGLLGEIMCLKLLKQFSSNPNETCYTWSLWCGDVHDINVVRPGQGVLELRQTVYTCLVIYLGMLQLTTLDLNWKLWECVKDGITYDSSQKEPVDLHFSRN